MGEHTAVLDAEIQRSTNEFIRLVESFDDAAWKRMVDDTGWSVGVTAHHLGTAWQAAAAFMQCIIEDREIPSFGSRGLAGLNADHARDFANVTKQEAVEALRQGQKAAIDIVGSMTDDQLEMQSQPLEVMGGQTATPHQFADMVIIKHIDEHRAAIEKALGRQSGAAQPSASRV